MGYPGPTVVELSSSRGNGCGWEGGPQPWGMEGCREQMGSRSLALGVMESSGRWEVVDGVQVSVTNF